MKLLDAILYFIYHELQMEENFEGLTDFSHGCTLKKNAFPPKKMKNKTIINKHMKLLELILHSYLP